MLGLASTLVAKAQIQDTLIVEHPARVVIAQDADTLSIRIAGSDQNPDFRYNREVILSDHEAQHTTSTQLPHSGLWDFSIIESDNQNSVSRLTSSFGTKLSGGIMLPLGGPDAMSGVRNFQSFEAEVGILRMDLTRGHSKNWYSLEWNLGMSNIKMKGDKRFMTDADGNVTFGSYPEGTEPDFSQLWWLEGRLEFDVHRSLGKGSSLGLGVIWAQRGSVMLCQNYYRDVDQKYIRQVNEMTGMRNNHWSFKAEYLFAAGFLHCGIYAKYSPWSQFHSGCGPDFSPFSVGFTFTL